MRQYARITGRQLPQHFWTYYGMLCAASKSRDYQTVELLRIHPNAKQYSEWIEDVKSVFKVS